VEFHSPAFFGKKPPTFSATNESGFGLKKTFARRRGQGHEKHPGGADFGRRLGCTNLLKIESSHNAHNVGRIGKRHRRPSIPCGRRAGGTSLSFTPFARKIFRGGRCRPPSLSKCDNFWTPPKTRAGGFSIRLPAEIVSHVQARFGRKFGTRCFISCTAGGKGSGNRAVVSSQQTGHH